MGFRPLIVLSLALACTSNSEKPRVPARGGAGGQLAGGGAAAAPGGGAAAQSPLLPGGAGGKRPDTTGGAGGGVLAGAGGDVGPGGRGVAGGVAGAGGAELPFGGAGGRAWRATAGAGGASPGGAGGACLDCDAIPWDSFCGDGVVGAHACDGGTADCAQLQFAVGLTTLSGTARCRDDCTWAFDECRGWPGGDYCTVGGYDDNGYCDECQLYGGAVDPDCAKPGVCGPPLDGTVGAGGDGGEAGASAASDGFCTDRLAGHRTNCELAGFERDPDCGVCGDGVVTVNGYVGIEYCENTATGPVFINNAGDCADWGYSGGNLACASNCTPDFSGCR